MRGAVDLIIDQVYCDHLFTPITVQWLESRSGFDAKDDDYDDHVSIKTP